MYTRTVDFGGGRGTGEDKKALLERTRAERQARQRVQTQLQAAAVLHRFARRVVARARARQAVRSAFESRWAQHTSGMASRVAALKDNPSFDAALFPPEGRRLADLAALLALLQRTKPKHHAHPRSRAMQAVTAADDLKLLSLCAAIVKGAMDKSAGSERHNFFGAAAEADDQGRASWSRQCQSLIGMVLTRLLRDSESGPPRDLKSFALITSCLCMLLDPTRWNVPGAGQPPASASASASSSASPAPAVLAAALPQLSATVLTTFRALMHHLIFQQRLFTQLRQLLMQLCFPSTPAQPVVSSSSSSSAETAAPPTRPVAFISALMTLCFRMVEVCSLSPLPAPLHRGRPPLSERFLLAEPAYLFVAHILSIPNCHAFITPALVAALTRSGSPAAASSSNALLGALDGASPHSEGPALYGVVCSVLHQLLSPSHFQPGSYFLSTRPPPVFLTADEWGRMQPLLPQWSQYDSIHSSDWALFAQEDVQFNVPAPVHLLSTLCWLHARAAPLSTLSSFGLHEFISSSAALLRAFSPALLLIADSGRWDPEDAPRAEDDEHLPRTRALGAPDNGAVARSVRREALQNVELLFRQGTVATALNHAFIEGHAILASEGDARGGSAADFAARLRSYALLDASPNDTQLFLRAFHAFTAQHPAYFSSLLTLLKALQLLRAGGARLGALSVVLRNNGLSWLSFSTPFLACVWDEMQARIGCPLSEQISAEGGGGGYATGSSASGGGKGSSSSSSSSSLLSFFGLKSSATGSGTAPLVVTNRNRWEAALLTSRSGVGVGVGAEASVTDLLLLWLSLFVPLLFILEDEELLHKLPSLPQSSSSGGGGGGGVATLVSLVHLLKTLVFRLIFNRYETDHQRAVDYALYADLLPPAQALLRELHQRDTRRPFMHLGATAAAATAAASSAAQRKAAEAARRQQQRGSYASLATEMDELSVSSSASASASSVPQRDPGETVEDTASLDRRAAHWLLSSGGGLGQASQRELQCFERDFEAWSSGGGAGGAIDSDLADPASPLAQRLVHLLHAMPFILSFSRRVSLLRSFIRSDGTRFGYGADAHQRLAAIEMVVRRDHVVHDGLEAISRLGRHFKQRVRVKFIEGGGPVQDGYPSGGVEERGIDLGGLFKEFLEIVCKEVFRVEYGLFTRTPQGRYYPNPSAPLIQGEGSGDLLRCIGRLVGKALYENILLDIPLAGFFLARFIGQGVVLADLAEMDAELYRSLMLVKRYPGDVRDLCLNFTVASGELEGGSSGGGASVELMRGGADIEVTNANRTLYVYKLAHHHLSGKLAPVMQPFLAGLADVVHLHWLTLFNTAEMRMLLSGSTLHDIDVDDWARHSKYEECSAGSKQVAWLWECVKEMKPEEKAALLKFTTSCSRPPLQGFTELQPPFTVRLIPLMEAPAPPSQRGFFKSLFSSRPSLAQLPSAATCFNTYVIC